MDFYCKLFVPHYSGFSPSSQTAITCFDFNFTDHLKISKRWYIVLGVGINQKWWSEKGFYVIDDGLNVFPTYSKIKIVYINIQAGLLYDFITYKRLTLNLGQLITPEIGNADPDYLNRE